MRVLSLGARTRESEILESGPIAASGRAVNVVTPPVLRQPIQRAMASATAGSLSVVSAKLAMASMPGSARL